MAGRRFVIGDIHGCFKTFENLIARTLRIDRSDSVYLLGDYIDRGPSSKETVDLILNMMDAGFGIFPIRGNHEQMLVENYHNEPGLYNWLQNGAVHTLRSFGISNSSGFDKRYIDFFESLPFYHIIEGFVLVHGAINFAASDPFSDTNHIVWGRPSAVARNKIGGRRVICGHTPVPLGKVKESLGSDIIMLDGGCVYHKVIRDLGYLCALELNSMQLFSQINIE